MKATLGTLSKGCQSQDGPGGNLVDIAFNGQQPRWGGGLDISICWRRLFGAF